VICPTHGEHSNKVKEHTKSEFGCKECALDSRFGNKLLQRKKGFLKRVGVIHPESKYDLSNCLYIDSQTKVEIYCNTCHNSFMIAPKHFVAGHGCPKCGKRKAAEQLSGFYNIKVIERNKDRHIIENNNLYVMSMDLEGDIHYKIGIAMNVPNRLSTIKMHVENPELLFSFPFNTYKAFYLEQYLHEIFNKFRYKTLRSFPGHTEVFTLSSEHLIFIKDFLEEAVTYGSTV